MIALSVNDISCSFADREVLSGVTFAVNEKDRVGIIGENGAGKSTLFRIICGERADGGSVSIAKGKTVGMLAQITDLSEKSALTLQAFMEEGFAHLLAAEKEMAELEAAMHTADGEKAVSLSMQYDRVSRFYHEEGGAYFRGKCRAMLARMGFGEDADVRTVAEISGGQHTRLALARLLATEPDILLLDEPTNHLDIAALSWLEEYLSSYPKTVLVISHDRYFLDKVTDHTLEIERTKAVMYKGNYSRAKLQRQSDEAAKEKRRREQMKVRARIEANIAFQRRCGQEHNFVTIRSKEKQLARMETIEKTQALRTVHMKFGELKESAGEVICAKELSFAYGQKEIFSELSFLIEKGERVLFLGNNGTGKSTLMKVICGELLPSGGSVELGYNIVVGYYDQEMHGLCLEHTVFEELREAFPQKTDLELRSALAQFLFGAERITQPLSTLSGGERARVLLCKLMLKKVNLLVMDEPTNHLDIASREALEDALAAFEGTVVAVSHDRYFIDRVASRIIEILPDGGGMADFLLDEEEGAYTAYLRQKEKWNSARPIEVSEKTESDAKVEYEQRKKEKAQKQSEQRKRERAAKRIPELEEMLDRLAEELNTSAATNYVRAEQIVKEQEILEEELLSLYELLEE